MVYERGLDRLKGEVVIGRDPLYVARRGMNVARDHPHWHPGLDETGVGRAGSAGVLLDVALDERHRLALLHRPHSQRVLTCSSLCLFACDPPCANARRKSLVLSNSSNVSAAIIAAAAPCGNNLSTAGTRLGRVPRSRESYVGRSRERLVSAVLCSHRRTTISKSCASTAHEAAIVTGSSNSSTARAAIREPGASAEPKSACRCASASCVTSRERGSSSSLLIVA